MSESKVIALSMQHFFLTCITFPVLFRDEFPRFPLICCQYGLKQALVLCFLPFTPDNPTHHRSRHSLLRLSNLSLFQLTKCPKLLVVISSLHWQKQALHIPPSKRTVLSSCLFLYPVLILKAVARPWQISVLICMGNQACYYVTA